MKMKKFVLLTAVISAGLVLLGCSGKEHVTDIESVVRQCELVRTECPESPSLPLNQASGYFGGSFSRFGLHVRPDNREAEQKYGNTTFLNIDRWLRGKFNMDYLLPVCRIYWGEEFKDISDYEQRQSYYDGTITTRFSTAGTGISVKSWFDPVDHDMVCFMLNAGGSGKDVIVEAEKILHLHYSQEVPQKVEITGGNGRWTVMMSIAGEEPVCCYVYSDAEGSVEDNCLRLSISGDKYVRIAYGSEVDTTVEESLRQTEGWWHDTWQNTGILEFPDREAQLMWVRSMYLQISSFRAQKKGLLPPTGFAGNCWPFAYSQDLSYIAPVLLSTGHLDVVKAWTEYYAERIDGMKDYARRLFGAEGAFCPWGYPYGSFDGYHDPEVPNRYYYEIHNSAYMARMAYEASIYVNDEAWTKKYAEPIIRECAAFYRSICNKEDDGRWHVFATPGMGQDEMGGFNQKDYLCSLYSAKYCFERAVLMGLDPDWTYSKILKEGLAFPSLKSEKGYYYACQGSGEKDFGMQKHPVQLNELAYLPTEMMPSEAASAAYAHRYEITERAGEPFFWGWTLGEFMLSSSRMGDVEGWKKDWGNMVPSENIDPDFIQVYEGSRTWNISYYASTNGLFQQSLLNNVICDWYGKLEIGKCYPWEGVTYLKDIRSLLGVKVSGKVSAHKAVLELEAWKDASFLLNGELIKLKNGETLTKTLNY